MAADKADDVELARHHSSDDNEPHRTASLVSRPFAGRIGGNQQFIVSPGDPSFQSIVDVQPDAAAKFSWKQSFNLRPLSDVELWKQATIEGVGTSLLIYQSGLFSLGLFPALTETSLGPITPATFGAILNALSLTLFIYSGGPVSGGHFNPLISMATFFARLSTFPRTILYILFQSTGALVAGFMLRASLGEPITKLQGIPGCYINTSTTTPGQAYALETMTAFALVFIAFGVGLEPRQRDVFGPALSPILVGLALGFCSFSSSIAKPGYSGSALNPARCFGLMAASERFDYHYVHWFGCMTAAVLNGLLYWAIPIYKD